MNHSYVHNLMGHQEGSMKVDHDVFVLQLKEQQAPTWTGCQEILLNGEANCRGCLAKDGSHIGAGAKNLGHPPLIFPGHKAWKVE